MKVLNVLEIVLQFIDIPAFSANDFYLSYLQEMSSPVLHVVVEH